MFKDILSSHASGEWMLEMVLHCVATFLWLKLKAFENVAHILDILNG
jgi:hypothetical protein